MSNRPIKEYSLGKCKAAVFQGEYNGKATFSVKFQKSYFKDNKWNNTDFFGTTDLRDLAGLVNAMLMKQVKERTPGQSNNKTPPQEERVINDGLDDFTPPDDSSVPF